MPTRLPKTGIRVTRLSKTGSYNDIPSITETVIFEGLRRVVDASSPTYDRFFPSGQQNKKRYLVYFEPEDGVQNDDKIQFNVSKLGMATSYNALGGDIVTVHIAIPLRTGTIALNGSRRVEAFCISNN